MAGDRLQLDDGIVHQGDRRPSASPPNVMILSVTLPNRNQMNVISIESGNGNEMISVPRDVAQEQHDNDHCEHRTEHRFALKARRWSA